MSAQAEASCNDWLLGRGERAAELKPNCRTVRVMNSVEHKAPFGTLIKYRVDYDS